MFKFSTNMAIVMMAFFISCGQEEVPGNSKNIGGMINALETEPLKNEEKELLLKTCNILRNKYIAMERIALHYPRNSFTFNTTRTNCSGQSSTFQNDVKLIDDGKNIKFASSNNTTFSGFKDILTDQDEPIRDFCKLVATDDLDERIIIQGDQLTLVTVSKVSNKTTLEFAFATHDSGDKYDTHSNEGFLIVDKMIDPTGTVEVEGVTINREASSSIGCTSGVNSLRTRLVNFIKN